MIVRTHPGRKSPILCVAEDGEFPEKVASFVSEEKACQFLDALMKVAKAKSPENLSMYIVSGRKTFFVKAESEEDALSIGRAHDPCTYSVERWDGPLPPGRGYLVRNNLMEGVNNG